MGLLENYSQTTQEIIEKVNCPHQVFAKDSTVAEVNEAYRNALARGKNEGFVPVLAVSDETLAEWLGILSDESYSIEEVINQEKGDGKEILKERFAQYMEDYADDMGGDREPEDDTLLSELLGEKEEGETILELSSFVSYTRDGIEETILFELPIKNPWEVIAWMPMGGWNECPEASEMMEVCRYWYEKYGAVPAVVSHDTLEFVVEKPIDNEEQAWELAKEHYAFCPDRVDQGTNTGTIGEVADCLSKSTVWYFWWD